MFAIALVIIALAVLFALGCYVGFRVCCVRSNPSDKVALALGKMPELNDHREEFKKAGKELEDLNPEPIYIKSHDGLLLHAKLVRGDNPNRVLIFMHGYRSSYNSDFIMALSFYRSMGFNIFLVDQRAHDRSDGRYISYGILEKHDCKCWIKKALEMFPSEVEIVLAGLSMGASTVLMASALDLPENVKAIVADCGFTSPYDIVYLTSKKINRYIPQFMVSVINLFCRIFAGFDLNDDNTLSAVQKTNIPIIYIHGTKDNFVPCEMTKRNFENTESPKELLMVPGAAHGISYIVDKERYETRIRAFLERYLK